MEKIKMHLYNEKEVLFEADLKSAVDLVVEDGWPVEMAARECEVPTAEVWRVIVLDIEGRMDPRLIS
tara:strand:+ start:301 stop:501 length:201 start_codon:yes stop_codon:yes gene_type:complete